MPSVPSCAEEQRAVDVGEIMGIGDSLPARMSLTRRCRRRCRRTSTARAVGAVVGAEEQRAVDIGEQSGIAGPASGVDVLDQDGAGGGAVGLPQLSAVVPSGALKNNVPLTLVRLLG